MKDLSKIHVLLFLQAESGWRREWPSVVEA
jgi:hypothetical protein